MKLSVIFASAVIATQTEDELFEIELIKDDTCYSNNIEVPCWLTLKSGMGNSATGTEAELTANRYNDLQKLFEKVWSKNGFRGKKNGFKTADWWAYGCQCHFLSDSNKGKGRAVDEIDSKCAAYKNCLKCVADKHGDDCNNVLRKYIWKWSSKTSSLMTTDRVGSCPQEIFACDKQFVEDTFALKSSYDVSWSAAGDGYGGPGFNNQEAGNCPAGGAGMGNKYCCGAGESPFRLINLNRSQCCGDYSIVANDQSCP